MAYIKTEDGLPNNCCATGTPITEGYWWAANVDAAIAGQGICEAEYRRVNGITEPPTEDAPTKAVKGRK